MDETDGIDGQAEDRRRRFEVDGYLFPYPVLSTEETASYRAHLEELGQALGGRLNRIDHCHNFLPWSYRLASLPRVLDAVEELLGPEIFLQATRVFAKYPGESAYVSWHQDGTYTNLMATPCVTTWIALCDSDLDNGCVRVLPGSHRLGEIAHREQQDDLNLLSHGQTAQLEIDDRQVVDMVLREGEMSIHHMSLLHSSRPNRSDRPRIGFSASYVTPDAPYSGVPAVHLRGSCRDHPFLLADEPGEVGVEEAVRLHRKFSRQYGVQDPKISASGTTPRET